MSCKQGQGGPKLELAPIRAVSLHDYILQYANHPQMLHVPAQGAICLVLVPSAFTPPIWCCFFPFNDHATQKWVAAWPKPVSRKQIWVGVCALLPASTVP